MEEGRGLLNAEQVAKLLSVSKSMGYKIIRKLNKELEEQGYLTLRGRIEERYLYERFKLAPQEEERGSYESVGSERI